MSGRPPVAKRAGDAVEINRRPGSRIWFVRDALLAVADVAYWAGSGSGWTTPGRGHERPLGELRMPKIRTRLAMAKAVLGE